MRPSHKQHVGLLPDDVSRGPNLSKSSSCVGSLDSAQPLSSNYIDALASRLSPHPRTSAVTIPRQVLFGQLDLFILQWEEVLCSGFDLTVLDPSDRRGTDMYVSLLLRITR